MRTLAINRLRVSTNVNIQLFSGLYIFYLYDIETSCIVFVYKRVSMQENWRWFILLRAVSGKAILKPSFDQCEKVTNQNS